MGPGGKREKPVRGGNIIKKGSKGKLQKVGVIGRSSLETIFKGIMVKGRGQKYGFFFHRMANAHRRNNSLDKIKINGVWLSEEQDVREGVANYRDFVKEEVMEMFKELHDQSSFLKSLNTTFLVLIPKKGGAEDLRDFRPISLDRKSVV